MNLVNITRDLGKQVKELQQNVKQNHSEFQKENKARIANEKDLQEQIDNCVFNNSRNDQNSQQIVKLIGQTELKWNDNLQHAKFMMIGHRDEVQTQIDAQKELFTEL
jgi:Sec-independent protein translocase protein TatA